MKYSKRLVERICSMIAEDDYTVDEICIQTGIARSSFFEWKASKADFLDAIKKAEQQRLEVFKKAARNGLLTLLNGKEYEETTTEYKEVNVGKGEDGLPIFKPRMVAQKKVKKFIMPNPTSVIFSLKNVDPEAFRDIISNEISGRDGSPIDLNVGNIVFK